MAFLGAVTVLLVILLALFVVMQVVVPAIRGTQLFPMFGTRSKLYRDLEAVKEEHAAQDIIDKINEERDNLIKRKSK